MKRSPVVVLLVLAAACGQGSHGTAVLKSEPTASSPAVPTLDPTTPPPVPSTSPTPLATATATATAVVRATTTATRPPAPVVTTHAPSTSPTPSPTPADTRPAATVVVRNRAGEAVKGTVGDFAFTLSSGHDSGRVKVHVDPAGNTGVGVSRADDPSCGEGGPKDLLAGHSYTYTITDGGSCGPGKTGPTGSLTEG